MAEAPASTRNGAWPLACAATLLVWLLTRIAATAMHGGLTADPDAAYGLVIARHLAQGGLTSFDGQTMTSGFSPLWVGILALQQRFGGPQLGVTFGLEAALLSSALWVLLRAAPVRSRFFQAAFTAAFAWIAAGMGLMGLEGPLLAFCFSLFVAALAWRTENLLGGLALGLSALLCVATRIEAALIVIPALLLSPTRLSNRVLGLLILGLGLLGYGAADLIKFGAALPMTSQLRSLGGVQFNISLVAQGIDAFARDGFGARLLITGAALALSPLLIPLSPPESPARALTTATAIGGWLLLLRLVLMSSWRVGPNQELAVLFPLIAGYFAIAPLLAAMFDRLFNWMGRPRLMQPAAAGLAALVLAGLIGQSALAATNALPPSSAPPADALARAIETLIREHAADFGHQRIAMGDGAGLLALAYDGPVMALEGQASDLAYLNALNAGGDVTPLLCAHGVRFFAAILPDLGAYDRLNVAVLSPRKTTFHGPAVEIDVHDEIVRAPAGGPDAAVLYVWRLGACWRNGYAALPAAHLLR